MKKIVLLYILLSLFVFSLYSQTQHKAKIFIPTIAGNGTMEDNAFFYEQLSQMLNLQYGELVRFRNASDYTLRGSIETITEADTNNNSNKIFILELTESQTETFIAKQYLVFNTLDTAVAGMLSTMVYNMFSAIPDIKDIDIRNKWLYLNVNGLWAPRVYRNQRDSIYWANFGFKLSGEYHFLNFMTAELGLNFVPEWISVSNSEEYRDMILEIPLALKFVFKPAGYYYTLEPYGGVALNFSMLNKTAPSLLSWLAGFQFNIKAGAGMITIDPRFSIDLFDSKIPDSIEYQRYMLQIGVGYKLGFFQKGNKDRGF